MPQKHLHHFSRGLAIGFELIGGCGIVFLICWGALIFRLSHGPMKVGFLTKRIERAFNTEQNSFRFFAGTTELTWGGRGHPFMFEMEHVRIERADGTPVLAVEKIGVRLSKRHLLFGQLVPRIIRFYAPALRVVRDADGHFSLNVGGAENKKNEDAAAPAKEGKPAAAAKPPVLPNAPDTVDIIKSLLAQMKNDGGGTLLGGLDEVSVTDAALLYQDEKLGVSWKSAKTDISFTRMRGGLGIFFLASIGRVPAQAAVLRGNFIYNWQMHRLQGAVAFTNLDPARLAQHSQALGMLAGADVPLSGGATLAFDRNFGLQGGHFTLDAGKGTFFVPGLFTAAAPVKSAHMRGLFNLTTGELKLQSLRADFSGPEMTGSGAVTRDAKGHAVTFDAMLKNMPLDKLKTYWPAGLAPDARGWVTGHLSAGTATQATLHLSLLSPALVCLGANAAPWDDFSTPQMKHVGGRIDFHGVKVDYFPPLMPVGDVKGYATYDNASFNLDISGGALGDMRVTHSKIAITGLDTANAAHHSKIDIAASLSGPLKTALAVLARKPLQYPQKLGLNTQDAAGTAAVDVDFKFPLYHALKIGDIKVTAAAAIDNLLLKDVAADMPLSGGPVSLRLAAGALDISGKGVLGTMPVTFDWQKNFSAHAPFDTRVKASLPLDAPSLAAFNVPPQLQVSGVIPATVTYTVNADHTASLLFNGDISAAGFTVPLAGYTKQPHVGGTLGMTVDFKNGAVTAIRHLNLETDKALVKGDLAFAAGGTALAHVALSQVKMGRTNVAVNLDRGGGAYDVNISGPSFDASRFLSTGVASGETGAAEKTTPVNLVMKVKSLITGPERSISDLNLSLRRNAWGRIDRMTATGVSGGAAMKLSYLPGITGHALRFTAGNAGAALSAMGLTDGVRGGKLTVTGDPDTNNPGGRDMRGSVYLMNFSLVNVPVLGRLLNALSLSGIIELLNGKGIAFHKMRCDFGWKDRGAPQTQKNVRLLTIRHGETSGASLGLTFKGDIDNWNNVVDMSGTIIPVSGLNKMVGFIPIVGDILTGGGKGVFAATYTIKGPKSDPEVTVNPLAVLAPGILRELFFEK